jgi:hypothetical protein
MHPGEASVFGRRQRHSGIRAALLSTFASLVLVSSVTAQTQPQPTIDNPAPDASASDGIYTPFTNRLIYQAIASDYQELVRISNEVLNVPDVAWTSNAAPPTTAAILKIYEEPVHANINGAYRRLRGFTFEPARATEVPVATAFYGTSSFLDTPVIDAIARIRSAETYTPNQRRQAIQKGVLNILRHWTMRYIDNGGRLMNAGQVDEAWAVYMGLPGPNNDYPNGLSQLARTRETNFNRVGTIDTPFRQALSRAQRAAASGDAESYGVAAREAHSRLSTIFYLGTVRYLNEPLNSVAAGDGDLAATQLVEGLSFYRSLQPEVATAMPDVDRTIVTFFNTPATDLTTAHRDAAVAALNSAASILLLSPSDLVAFS